MRCWRLLALLGVVFSLMDWANSQSSVYSLRNRFPGAKNGRSRFRLLAKPSGSTLRFGGKFGNARRHRGKSAVGKVKNADALKAGSEGSYDFKDQFNAIIPDRTYVKPTKAPVPQTTTVNPNKINIESRIAAVTESQAIVEKATVGGTAVLHCYFDDSAQIGDYRHSQIWWTKQPQRGTDRPVILGAGTQIRLPDDRLRLINFAGESYSILVIKDVVETDEGDYKCSLPTVSGTKMVFTSLQVYDPAEENIVTSAEENVAEVGEDLTLSCKPSNPLLNVWWTAEHKTGEKMQIVSGKNKVATRELKLTSLSRYNAGVYTCHVQVKVGSPIKKKFTVQVKERPWVVTAFNSGFNVDTFLAKFVKDPKYGGEVNLRCDSGGIPTPTISWVKDGMVLSSGGKYKIKSHEPTHTEYAVVSSITISNFAPSDEGKYQCVASNDVGTRHREFTLRGYYNSAVIRSSTLNRSSADDEDMEDNSNRSQQRNAFGDLIAKGNRKLDDLVGEGSGEGLPTRL